MLIAIADLVEDVRRSLAPDLGRLQRPVSQIGARDRGERHPVREPHAAARPDDDVAARLEVLDQQIEHARRHGVIDFEQRDRAVPLLAQAAIDDFQNGLGGVLRMGDRHFHVADDAEHVCGANAHAGKQLPEVLANHVFEHREPAHPVSAGKRDEPRQQVGHLDARELRPPFVLDDDREILAAIRDERKRMPGVERQRRQHGADVDVEMPLEIRAVVVGVVAGIENDDALVGKLSAQRLLPEFRQLREHRRGAVARARVGLVEAHHEKLVEVVGGDAEELGALEQRMAGPGLLQHPLIEGQPAELPVEIQRRIPEIGIRRRCSLSLAGTRRGRRAAVGLIALPRLPYQCQSQIHAIPRAFWP